jgi:hypothetical protein
MEYPNSVLTSFENGAMLDLRLRLAIEFLKTPLFEHALEVRPDGAGVTVQQPPAKVALDALDLAEALIAEGVTRGWVKALPDGDDLPAPLVRHIKRSVRANVLQQMFGQKVMADEQPKVATGGLPFNQ